MGRLSVTSTITPSLVNRFAAGINRFLNENGVPTHTIAGGYDAALGLTGLAPAAAFPIIKFSGNNYQGGTIDSMGVGAEDYSPNGSYIFQDDVTWIHGKHTLKFGYDYRRYVYNDRTSNSPGTFNFSPLQTGLPGYTTETGDAFASFLLGAANSANQNIVGYSSGFRQPEHGMYITDDWKITAAAHHECRTTLGNHSPALRSDQSHVRSFAQRSRSGCRQPARRTNFRRSL